MVTKLGTLAGNVITKIVNTLKVQAVEVPPMSLNETIQPVLDITPERKINVSNGNFTTHATKKTYVTGFSVNSARITVKPFGNAAVNIADSLGDTSLSFTHPILLETASAVTFAGTAIMYYYEVD